MATSEENELNELRAEIDALKAEKKRVQLNIVSIMKQSPIDLKSLIDGQIVKLQKEHFLTNLRYIRTTRDDRYVYSIGGRTITVDDTDLHETFLKYRYYIDTLVLQATEYQCPILDPETHEEIGDTETVLTLGFITIITVNNANLKDIIAAAKVHRKYKRSEHNYEESDEGFDSENSHYEKYGGAYGYDDDTIDSAFEGDPENYWNID